MSISELLARVASLLGGERHCASYMSCPCKNTTQWTRPGHEPRPLDPESNTLIIRPLHLLHISIISKNTNSQTCFFEGDGFFTSSCGPDESSFLFLDGCCVVLPFRFSFSFRPFSFPLSDSLSLFFSNSSSSGSSDLCKDGNRKFTICKLTCTFSTQFSMLFLDTKL